MKPLLNVYFIVFTMMCSARSLAQNSFWNSKQAYLGQIPPDGDSPQVFAPGILKDSGGIALDRVTISADGKEFYYCWAKKWFRKETAKIKYFKYENGRWDGPKTLAEKIYGPTFSTDFKTLYFLGEKGEVWYSKRVDDHWSSPMILIKKDYGLYDFIPTSSGTYYIASNRNGGKIDNWESYDICKMIIHGKDTSIVDLGSPVNTKGFDGDFYVSPDESFLIISTNETKDFESELYISFRKKDGTWTKPRSLGKKINNGVAHRWGQYVTPDRKFLFYTQGTSEADCYIYWLRFDKLLAKLKHEEFAERKIQ